VHGGCCSFLLRGRELRQDCPCPPGRLGGLRPSCLHPPHRERNGAADHRSQDRGQEEVILLSYLLIISTLNLFLWDLFRHSVGLGGSVFCFLSLGCFFSLFPCWRCWVSHRIFFFGLRDRVWFSLGVLALFLRPVCVFFFRRLCSGMAWQWRMGIPLLPFLMYYLGGFRWLVGWFRIKKCHDNLPGIPSSLVGLLSTCCLEPLDPSRTARMLACPPTTFPPQSSPLSLGEVISPSYTWLWEPGACKKRYVDR
jgi:hypothetical protein